jgi:hypothetical protein
MTMEMIDAKCDWDLTAGKQNNYKRQALYQGMFCHDKNISVDALKVDIAKGQLEKALEKAEKDKKLDKVAKDNKIAKARADLAAFIKDKRAPGPSVHFTQYNKFVNAQTKQFTGAGRLKKALFAVSLATDVRTSG